MKSCTCQKWRDSEKMCLDLWIDFGRTFREFLYCPFCASPLTAPEHPEPNWREMLPHEKPDGRLGDQYEARNEETGEVKERTLSKRLGDLTVVRLNELREPAPPLAYFTQRPLEKDKP
jgi:hypothetical protein